MEGAVSSRNQGTLDGVEVGAWQHCRGCQEATHQGGVGGVLDSNWRTYLHVTIQLQDHNINSALDISNGMASPTPKKNFFLNMPNLH